MVAEAFGGSLDNQNHISPLWIVGAGSFVDALCKPDMITAHTELFRWLPADLIAKYRVSGAALCTLSTELGES